MKHKIIVLWAGLLLVLFSTTGFAAYEIDSVIDHQISGGEMGGLKVTAYFSDESRSTAFWTENDENEGQAVNDDFYLYQGGDTYTFDWTIFNKKSDYDLISLKLEGWDASIVFDIKYDTDNFYTPGSDHGSINGISLDSVIAQDPVSLGGIFYGDLYATITLELSVSPVHYFSFLLDTDKVQAVPIPGAFLLLGSGLICLVGMKRRTL